MTPQQTLWNEGDEGEKLRKGNSCYLALILHQIHTYLRATPKLTPGFVTTRCCNISGREYPYHVLQAGGGIPSRAHSFAINVPACFYQQGLSW